MTQKRTVEIFSAGCAVCQETVSLVEGMACESCAVNVLDLQDRNVAERARQLGVRSVPAVVIDGILAECCSGRSPDAATLRAAGLGEKL